jgi:glycine/D-amino acid oxidase-like deaminating enzyme
LYRLLFSIRVAILLKGFAIMGGRQLRHSDAIVIVGAGAFGLSTALHLALRGYKDVTVLDRHEYDNSGYDYRSGADSASSGANAASFCHSLLT